jgi:quercetin dioxygenase-like cupin family protein
MFGKRAVLVGLMTTALVASAAAVASATDGSGETRMVIARGQSAHSFGIQQRKDNDVSINMNTFIPGGFSGWHSHPGTAVFVIKSGEITKYSEPVGGGECSVQKFTAGQVFIEQPEDEQNVVNTGTVDAVLLVTFFNVPHGGGTRMDQPDPGNCPG